MPEAQTVRLGRPRGSGGYRPPDDLRLSQAELYPFRIGQRIGRTVPEMISRFTGKSHEIQLLITPAERRKLLLMDETFAMMWVGVGLAYAAVMNLADVARGK